MLLFILTSFVIQDCLSLNILFLHPMYAGSHVLTLQSVTKELLDKGHHVTTVKFADSSLPTLMTANHANFSLIELTVNNSQGDLPFVTYGEEAEFRLPLELIWSSGKNLLWTIGIVWYFQYNFTNNTRFVFFFIDNLPLFIMLGKTSLDSEVCLWAKLTSQ